MQRRRMTAPSWSPALALVAVVLVVAAMTDIAAAKKDTSATALLHASVAKNDPEGVKTALAQGAPINQRIPGPAKQTPLVIVSLCIPSAPCVDHCGG